VKRRLNLATKSPSSAELLMTARSDAFTSLKAWRVTKSATMFLNTAPQYGANQHRHSDGGGR
jgi:hypothetical protein